MCPPQKPQLFPPHRQPQHLVALGSASSVPCCSFHIHIYSYACNTITEKFLPSSAPQPLHPPYIHPFRISVPICRWLSITQPSLPLLLLDFTYPLLARDAALHVSPSWRSEFVDSGPGVVGGAGGATSYP